MLPLLFLPLLAAAEPAQSNAPNSAAPWNSASWRALLHYDGTSSNVAPASKQKSSAFFLTPNGHENPQAEWEATEKILQEPDGPCRYPARAIYFNKKPVGQGQICERWEKWKNAVSADGIELVFAAAFLNSPSSMYGHTLLKFPKNNAQELLHYTLNYGADTEGSGGFSYVWNGLTGGFQGRYATAPFYLKVKEYNQVENRDFWIYSLNVTKQELEILVAHAWELRDVDFPYYFLHKNCSYYLLEFLEVARPGQELVKAFPLWSVPMDTIRRLKEKGWIETARFRPSRQKILEAHKKNLSSSETSVVANLLKNPNTPIPLGREAPVLEAAYQLFRYRTEGKHLTPEEKKQEEQLLKQRASAGAYNISVPEELPPETGHLTNRASLAYGMNRQNNFAEFSYRASLHDLLSRSTGLEPHSELSMGDFRFRLEQKRFFLERFDLLRLRSVAPLEAWFPRTAWSFRTGAARAKEMDCTAWHCLYGYLQGGWGVASRLGPFLFFALAEIDAEVGGVFDPNYRLSVGPSGGMQFPLWPGARVLLEGEARYRLLGEKRQKRSARLGINQDVSKNWELRLESEVHRNQREGLLKVLRYF